MQSSPELTISSGSSAVGALIGEIKFPLYMKRLIDKLIKPNSGGIDNKYYNIKLVFIVIMKLHHQIHWEGKSFRGIVYALSDLFYPLKIES